jgi:hypothetical protein
MTDSRTLGLRKFQYANEVLDKKLRSAARKGQPLACSIYSKPVVARDSLHQMLYAKLREQEKVHPNITSTPRALSPSRVLKPREEQNNRDGMKDVVRRRLKRERQRMGRPKKYGGHELSRSESRSDSLLALPSGTSQDEEIVGSIEVKSSLRTATSPTQSEGPYSRTYSFSTGDDPPSNISPSSLFSDTATQKEPSLKDVTQVQSAARLSEASRYPISIPIPAPTQTPQAIDTPIRFRATHILIKSETLASDGQSKRSQRPKGPEGLLKVNPTKARPWQLRLGTTSAVPSEPRYIPAIRTHDFSSVLRTRKLGINKWYGHQIDVRATNAVLETYTARNLACWRKPDWRIERNCFSSMGA